VTPRAGTGSPRPGTVVVALSANPAASASVPLIGYHLARELGEITSSVLVAHARDRGDLEAVLPADRLRFAGSARFSAVLRRVGHRLFPDRWGLIGIVELPGYLLFDVHAFFLVRRLLRGRRVDYVLRVNPVSLLMPSILGRLPVPVVTGPHNGGLEWPEGFRHLDAAERTGQRFRFLGEWLHRLYGDYRRYALILVGTDACGRAVPRPHRNKVVVVPENGVERVHEIGPHAGDATRLLFVGRLVPVKAVDLLVRALARLPPEVELTIVGDGPACPALGALAAELGVAGRCHFPGWCPHDELDRMFAEAGVFVFPSVRESGGAAVLEAMSHGLPCLVADWGGPRIYTGTTGIHLSVDSPDALVDDIVGSVEALLADPDRSRDVGRRSQEVVRSGYTWASKARTIDRLAREAARRA